MARVEIGGLEFCYQVVGAAAEPPLVLIMGLGSQLTHWPDDLVARIADCGFRVVIFDNRDAGLSSRVPCGPPPDLARLAQGVPGEDQAGVDYTLIHMAADTAGLIAALDLAPAHLVGISMGGRIAQLTAALHPEAVRALVPIMTFTGDPALNLLDVPARDVLFAEPEDETDPDSILDHLVRVYSTIGGGGFPWDKDDLRRHLARCCHRAYDPEGTARQTGAVLATPFDATLFDRIAAPTLVIHGDDDPLVPPDRGRDVARRIPAARLEIVPGMGHTLAPGLRPILADLIAEHCLGADAARG